MTDTNVADYLASEAKSTARPLTEALQKRKPATAHLQPVDPGFVDRVPPDHHPDALGPEIKCNTYGTAYRALTELHNVHTQLIDTARSVANKAELAKTVEPIAIRAIKAMQSSIEALDRQIEHAETEITKSLGSGIGQIAQEVRTVVRSVPERERMAFVRGLVASRDVEALKAIAAVNPMLSGLDETAYGFVRSECERLTAPAYVQERDVGRAARQRMARALEHFDSTMANNVRRWRSSDDQKLANLVKNLQPKKDD